MNPRALVCLAGVGLLVLAKGRAAALAVNDPRLRDIVYNPHAVFSIPVKRGVVTLVELEPGDAITEIAAGLGGDCTKPDAAWCISAQPGGRDIFVKPKTKAEAPNNLAVVTNRRTYAFRFDVLADRDPRPAMYRLRVQAPPMPPAPSAEARSASAVQSALAALLSAPVLPPAPPPQELVKERLQARPRVVNSNYSIAEGRDSDDIVPTLIFDDGRFTYLRFPGNRSVPAVFDVLVDGSETLVNARMENDLLVVDRVSRRLMLRAGQAVVGVWNDSFDLDGVPPEGGTTVAGVQRVLRSAGDGSSDAPPNHSGAQP